MTPMVGGSGGYDATRYSMLMIFWNDCILTAQTDMISPLKDSDYTGIKKDGGRMTPSEVQEALDAYRADLEREARERRAWKDSFIC